SQLIWKQKIVRETLRRIGGIVNIEVEPCLTSPSDRNYRTIARYPAHMTQNELLFGYFERRSYKIVDIQSCPVAIEKVNDTASAVRLFINENFPYLDIRELTLQCSLYHRSMLLSITLGSRRAFSESLESIFTGVPGLSGVSFRYIESPKVSKYIRSYGDHHRYEIINGKQFRIDERSFFQINIPQTEQLVDTVKDMIGDISGGKIIDGYGGVGLFSLSIASQNTDIYLFDTSFPAVKDSMYNARNMEFSRFHGRKEPAGAAFTQIGKAEVLIIDPPRTGLGTQAIKAACFSHAEILVYVSCDPTTLSRDLKMFCENGYEIQRVVPVDMFPHTYHIETVVKLQRK
ncbi:MAG: class I SAM-dependent RNA methyltransferase, partial [Candidatus Latescibacteria bacterium]|nr:class I SAM-dependent RNA methyltransferase [Candidatus Latescibacterota bacterium]